MGLYPEFVYVEFTLVGPLPEIFQKIEEWLFLNNFDQTQSHINKKIVAELAQEDLSRKMTLEFTETEKVFDPQKVYGDAPNPTQL